LKIKCLYYQCFSHNSQNFVGPLSQAGLFLFFDAVGLDPHRFGSQNTLAARRNDSPAAQNERNSARSGKLAGWGVV
jgi:hypothetical protein